MKRDLKGKKAIKGKGNKERDFLIKMNEAFFRKKKLIKKSNEIWIEIFMLLANYWKMTA